MKSSKSIKHRKIICKNTNRCL